MANDLYIKAKAPSTPSTNWVRPSGWLTLPTITSADTKIVGLVAVYEFEENAISIQALTGTSQNYNIDWGDGTSQTGTTTTVFTKRYDYASVSSTILVDDFGYNYKQVIVTITNNSGTVTSWGLSAGVTQAGPSNWLDLSFSWAANLSLNGRGCSYLQRLQIYKATLTGNINNWFETLVSLRFLRWENITYSGVTQASTYMGEIGNIDSINFSFTPSPAISVTNFFIYSKIKKLGNVDFSTTNLAQSLFNSSFIEEIGTLNVAASVTNTSMFAQAYNLSKIGTITSTAMTNMTSMFSGCYKVKEIVFTSCANVTTTTTAFNSCISLRKLRMPGIAATFSITGCNMQRPELIDLFNDLATVTAKTITITNNPGVADLTAADLLIATGKGWTVTT